MDSDRSDPPEYRMKILISRSQFPMDNKIPARRYFHSGDQLIRQADTYLKQKDLERAFVLYLKFSSLFAEKIRDHPEYRSIPRETRLQTIRKLEDVLVITENLKGKILQKYRDEFDEYSHEKKMEESYPLELKQEEGKNMESSLNIEYPIKNLSENMVKTTGDTNTVRPISYLPDDFQVYPISDVNSCSKRPEINSVKTATKPGVDRSTKPKTCISDKLRTINIPTKIMETFLALAQNNTDNNKETCGILAGKLRYNRFIITHLVIPKQDGSPDSCTTNNEEELFMYQDKHSLITVGWIHTHPSQTAFLSSVDLHTHYAYQLMMPEAIAIVCAPRYQETGFFHLTPKYGLQLIGNCQQQGFHPHPSDPPIFQYAEHCEFDNGADIEVEDMR